MPIRVVCPNGHALQVKSEWAGKSGLCPVCKVRIQIPTPSEEDFSEESIMSLLGRPEAAPKPAGKPSSKPATGVSATNGRQQPPKKACDKCKQEVPKAMTICPHCHTFIGNTEDR
ncbi:MAG: hypothetical protein ABR915_09885 [Thermoguttaceae bacterium]|jgi:RNA polymerase subunit RPABC4/transcription elongation factor Spt4